MKIKKPTHATVVAYLALFFAMGGTAAAATGSTFITGRGNAATTTTTLTNSAGTALSLNSKAGTPPPAPAPAQSRDTGFAISDLQITQDSLGDWDGVARITNETSGVRSGSFTITIFRSGSVIATLSGNVSSLAAGNTNTVSFFSSDAFTEGEFTTEFQTDTPTRAREYAEQSALTRGVHLDADAMAQSCP